MNSRIRYYSSDHLALVLIMILGIVLLIHLSTESNLSYAQPGLTNTSTMFKKPGPSIQVPEAISNATMAKIRNLSIQVPEAISNATIAKLGNLSIILSTKPASPVNIISNKKTGYTYEYFPDMIPSWSKLYHECPREVVILVHGRSNTETPVTSALEEFDRAAISIERNFYYSPIIGFLWSTGQDPIANFTTDTANAGTALANFLSDFTYHCNRTALRIAAHSTGTNVLYNAINDLSSSPRWNDNKYKIESIHFLGSELPINTFDIHTPFGRSVQNFVGHFYNLYSPHDDILSSFGVVLGNSGTLREITIPTNYKDTNVAKEILDPLSMHETHLGYWGFRDKSMHLIDDGAMNVVVSDWLKDSPVYIAGTKEIIGRPDIVTNRSR